MTRSGESNTSQQAILDDAREVISQNKASLPGNLMPYVKTAMNAKVRVHDTLKLRGEAAWGSSQLYGQWAGEVIHINKTAFFLDKRLLASLLIHEAVHVHQWIPGESRNEPPAYQAQSDALRAWGLTVNSIGEARILFPGDENDEFLDDLIFSLDEFQTVNPALRR